MKKWILFLAFFSLACSSASKEEDPLKYTKKLTIEGHRSLYNNGAFQVGHTEIYLIPPADVYNLGLELMGVRARQSFVSSLKEAGNSYSVVAEGGTKTYRLTKKTFAVSQDMAKAIDSMASSGGTVVMDRSTEYSKNIIGGSFVFSKKVAADIVRYSNELFDEAGKNRKSIIEHGTKDSLEMRNSLISKAGEISSEATSESAHHIREGFQQFVVGYLTLPKKIGDDKDKMKANISEVDYTNDMEKAKDNRRQFSKKQKEKIKTTFVNYFPEIKESFSRAKYELEDSGNKYGYSLPILKSVGWVLKGVFWDSLIKPVGKISTASLGYLGYNTIYYPIMVVEKGGKKVGHSAVEFVKFAGKSVYRVLAPTGRAAIAAVIGSGQFIVGQTIAGGTYVAGQAAGAVGVSGSYVGGYMVDVVGKSSAVAMKYVGVPLTTSGIVVGGVAGGVVVGGVGNVSGAAVKVGGKLAAGGAYGVGAVTSGVVGGVGTVASVGAGAAYGIYQLSKAAIVPVGYEVAGGVVLGYGTVTQLAGHTLLALSDFSYLVLSLEGPRWVLYAVKGDLSNGDDLPQGTVLDLGK